MFSYNWNNNLNYDIILIVLSGTAFATLSGVAFAFLLYNIYVQQENIELIEFIEANPFTPVRVLIADFLGGDLVMVLKAMEPIDREKIIHILNQYGLEDVL